MASSGGIVKNKLGMRVGFLLSLITFSLAIRGYAQTDVVPPPLAFSNWDTDEQEYRVIDFASGEVTTIPRTGGISRMKPFYESPIPKEALSISPYDETIKILFINESYWGVASLEGNGVYRIFPNGERKLLNEAGFPLYPLEWSPNGRYFYFRGDVNQIAKKLFQYDLYTETLTPILESPQVVYAECNPAAEWCTLQSYNSPDSFEAAHLYLLNTNTGDVRFISLHKSYYFTEIWWQDDAPTFFYSQRISEEREVLRLYNYHDHTDMLISEVDAFLIENLEWSPDHRWLIFTAIVGQWQHEMFAVNFESDAYTPRLLTEHTDFSIHTYFNHWQTSDKLFFGLVNAPYEYDLYEFYLSDLSTGQTLKAAEFSVSGSLIDDVWSPDGRWLALSYGSYGDSNNLYIVDSHAEVPFIEVPVNYDPPYVICVGWYTPKILLSGEANLCDDVYMGIG